MEPRLETRGPRIETSGLRQSLRAKWVVREPENRVMQSVLMAGLQESLWLDCWAGRKDGERGNPSV